MHPVFENTAAFFVISGFIAALLIKSDISSGHPQKMKIMCPVWVLSGLWGSWAALYAYFKIGRPVPGNPQMNVQMSSMEGLDMTPVKPLWQRAVLSTLHCGAGCALADIAGEWFTYFIPVSAFGRVLAGQWILDYILALIFGAGFQYAVIRSMEGMSPLQTAFKALKIDFLSLTAWQAGMYAFMALMIFGFGGGSVPSKTGWEFWFIMQLAMFCGFAVSYPVNRQLVKRGLKKTM